jgi:hypothetical protein
LSNVCNTAEVRMTHPTPRAPLRRLTVFEYHTPVRELLGDTTQPGFALPSETSGNGFGNDADQQSIPPVLAEGYVNVAADIAARATGTAAALAALAPCASTVATATEATCGRSFIDSFLPPGR